MKLHTAMFLIAGVAGSAAVATVLVHCDETAQVAHDELGPKALLRKYTWLKEAHASLDQKRADIKVYQGALDSLTAQYQGVPRNQWARSDLDSWSQQSQALAGTIASYNDLAAQYNAKMAEVNWSFANVGQLPQGATEPLPRDYAPYQNAMPASSTK